LSAPMAPKSALPLAMPCIRRAAGPRFVREPRCCLAQACVSRRSSRCFLAPPASGDGAAQSGERATETSHLLGIFPDIGPARPRPHTTRCPVRPSSPRPRLFLKGLGRRPRGSRGGRGREREREREREGRRVAAGRVPANNHNDVCWAGAWSAFHFHPARHIRSFFAVASLYREPPARLWLGPCRDPSSVRSDLPSGCGTWRSREPC